MKTNIFSNKVFISFIAVCVYFLVIYFISDFVYFANDDRMLQFIVSGHSADPSYYTMFLSWHVSMLFTGLYSLIPSFPFYGCLFFICIFTSIWYTTFFILKKSSNVWVSVFLCGVLFVVMYRLICNTSFTYIPAFLVMPLVLIAFELKIENKKAFIFNLILFTFFSLLAIGIRRNIFLLAIPFLLLIIIIQNIKDRTRRITFVLFPIILFSCGFSFVGDAVLQTNPEYKKAVDYSNVRASVMDYYGLPDYEQNESFYLSLNISKDAYELMCNWFFDIPEASIENLKAIRDYQTQNHNKAIFYFENGEKKFFYGTEGSVKAFFYAYKKTYELLIVTLALIIISFITLLNNNKKYLLILFGNIIGTLIISLFLSFFMKFPSRVASCLLIFNLIVSIYFMIKYSKISLNALKYFSIYSLCSILIVSFALGATNTSFQRNATTCYRDLELHISSDADYVYFFDPYNVLNYNEKLFNTNRKAYNVYYSGWHIYTPYYNQMVKNWGETTFYDYIKNGKPLKYVASKSANPNDISFNRYIQSKLNRKFVKCEEYKGFVIYEVVLI